GTVMGTPDFIDPEQVTDSHTADIRADLYSLGCTLYYLLTGKPPFPGHQLLEKLYKHKHEEPVPLQMHRPDVSPAVAAVVARLMRKHPKDRYQLPGELAAALVPSGLDAEALSEGDLPTVSLISAGVDPLPGVTETFAAGAATRAFTTSSIPTPPPPQAIPVAAPAASGSKTRLFIVA